MKKLDFDEILWGIALIFIIIGLPICMGVLLYLFVHWVIPIRYILLFAVIMLLIPEIEFIKGFIDNYIRKK